MQYYEMLMSLIFKDYFSEKSEEYREYRPRYPANLFSYLSSITVNNQRAWDCATGNGQSALALSDYFTEVIATDASSTQIENSVKREKIKYRVATAEDSGIETNSIDLITVAQALHWFNLNKFINEVNRVLKVGGVIAIWAYNLFSVQDDIDEIVKRLYNEKLADYWPNERKLVENGYRDIILPFDEIDAPIFNMSEEWNFSKLIGYLNTWSAVKIYHKHLGISPLDEVQIEILKLWDHPEKTKKINWPMSVRIWEKIHNHKK